MTERVRRAAKSLRLEHPSRPRHGDTGVLRAPARAEALDVAATPPPVERPLEAAEADRLEAAEMLLLPRLASLQEALAALRDHDARVPARREGSAAERLLHIDAARGALRTLLQAVRGLHEELDRSAARGLERVDG